MKNILLIATLFFINLGFSQDYGQMASVTINSESENFDMPSVSTKDLAAFDIKADMVSGDIVFSASENIDYINIYNNDNQEIFSAKGSIIEDNKINVSFLTSGTYSLEIVIGKDRASHKIVRK